MRHRTTNHDLDRLRALAAEGACMSEAARQVGMSTALVRHWRNLLRIDFLRGYKAPHRLPAWQRVPLKPPMPPYVRQPRRRTDAP